MPIQCLKDGDLENELKNLVQKERELLHEILLHIQEIDRRKLYLKKAYSSLFVYLTEELKYSAAAAQRRIEASRLSKQIPELIEKIQTGELNLSNIGEMQRAIKISEKESSQKISVAKKKELLNLISYQSSKAAQKICAQALDLPVTYAETEKIQKDDSRQINLTLTAEASLKIEKVKGLMAASLLKDKDLSTSHILERLCDLYLEKKLGKALGLEAKSTSAAEVKQEKPVRSLPALKRRLLQKNSHCQWKDPKTGRECQSHFNLQIDHIQPRWNYGGNRPENLRILCQRHNLYRYEKGI